MNICGWSCSDVSQNICEALTSGSVNVLTNCQQTKKRTVEGEKDKQNLLTTLQTTEGEMKQWVKEVEEWAASSKMYPVAI